MQGKSPRSDMHPYLLVSVETRKRGEPENKRPPSSIPGVERVEPIHVK